MAYLKSIDTISHRFKSCKLPGRGRPWTYWRIDGLKRNNTGFESALRLNLDSTVHMGETFKLPKPLLSHTFNGNNNTLYGCSMVTEV